jgi:5-hydroxyisourate hydrolase-like protein (transthyretin family)
MAGLVCAAPAQAGTYRVWTCHGPDGSAVSIRDSISGWIPAQRPGTQFMTLDDRCAQGGGIHAHMGGNPAHAWGGSWNFTPPAGTSLAAYSLTWSGTVGGLAEATLARSDTLDPDYPERNVSSFGSHTVTQGGFDVTGLFAIAACSFAGSGNVCGADPVDFSISRAVLTLNDFHPPDATEVSGDLVGTGPLRGTMSVAFAGTDVGGGLYRVVVTADGKDVASAAVPDAAGRCVEVDRTDAYSFKWPQPCPLSVRATVPLDTSRIPEGTSLIGVSLEDAAGNRTPLSAPVQRSVVKRGAVNGANGGDGAVLKRTGRYRVTTSFGKRRPLLRGTLTRGGAPVADAALDVLAQTSVNGASAKKIAETRTDAQGRYRVRAPGGPSRTLRVSYKAYVADAGYATQTSVLQRVRARVTLAARTRHVALRGTARFSGAVRGGYVPKRGKLVELQAFDAGRWRTFATVRTNRKGRFSARYSFKHITVPRSYRFRARSRFEPGYPFLLGVSSSVRVGVG